MIRIDFLTALGVGLSLSLLLVIGHWIFYTYNKSSDLFNQAEFLEQCPFCALIFFDYKENVLKICPRCHSYLAASNESTDGKEGSMRSKLNNEAGVVLVTVLAISMVLIVLVLGALSTNVNQITLGERVIDRVRAEEYAKGNLWINHTLRMKGQTPLTGGSTTMDGKSFSYSVTNLGATGPNGTTRSDITLPNF